MKSFEVHAIEAREDVDGAIIAGLLDPDDLDGAQCAACSERIANTPLGFEPFAIVLDDGDQCWFACLECCADVLAPEDSVSLEDIFAREEEFDSFDLTDDD